MDKSKKALLSFAAISLFTVAVVIFLLFFGPISAEYKKFKEYKHLLKDREMFVDLSLTDGRAYAIISREGRSDHGDLLVIFEEESGWKRIYENDFADLKPWKITIADIDGDGMQEILTAVRKSTHYDSREGNRLFIFNFKNDLLVKKWTGSQIAGEWKQFYAGDFLPMKGDELIFVQRLPDGRERLVIYYWFAFGFIMLAESDAYDNISDLQMTDNNLIKLEYGNNETLHLTVKDGRIVAYSE
ncbi:MAG: hypothetical protein GX757_08250 [Clostridiales bacterium]|nr:hypothetical protein [Clostridiales bacterium]